MSGPTQDGPVMAGNDDASDQEKLAGLVEQVDHDYGAGGAGAMADALRGRLDETKVVPEDPGDLED